MRLSRSAWRRAPLQGRSAMPTPFRFTTASTPSNVPGVDPPRGRIPAALVGCRGLPADQAQHLVPSGPQVGDEGGSDQAGRSGHDDAHAAILSPSGAGARVDARPVSGEAQVGLERALLQALADRGDEAAGVRAVDEPVVVGQRQVAPSGSR